MGNIVIRDLQGFSEYNDCVDLQREVWAFPDVDIVPAAQLLVQHRWGGVCIGAFDEAKMVGFVCGLVGWQDGELFHHSHMIAVLPAYRRRGLGEALKWAQRDRVLDQGMKLINWTYDPLQVLNAKLNIDRLGAVARKYFVNLYGEGDSPLWGGIPTDRFEAEWWIESARVVGLREGRRLERPGWEKLPRANRTGRTAGFRRCEDEMLLDLEDGEILVEAPADITFIMARDRGLALDWRMKTRRIFQDYFNRGYGVVGFHRSQGRYFYRLEKQNPA